MRFRNLEKDSARSMSFVFWVDNKKVLLAIPSIEGL